MRLSDPQRAAIAETVARQLVDQFGAGVAMCATAAEADEQDIASIAVLAFVSVATAFAGTRCIDAAAAVALIHVTAESCAADIYGAEG